MAEEYEPSRRLTIAVYVLGAAGVGALVIGVAMQIGLLFLGGVGAVVGALIGHNTLDAHARRKTFEANRDQPRGPWG